ncbi:MAG: MCE family protein, partial [Planctomycetes bacterium]|nr:MCE family protein [Planctomycetota bacterium]
MTSKLPSAVVAPRKRPLGSLVLPVLALLIAGWLGVTNWAVGGPLITVHAQEGHGIKAGDPLRYRGIHVGAVESVSLEPDLSGVRLEVRLDPEAEALARRGSRFWVVRPHLGLDSVQGLETVVGARYLSVLPGPDGAPPAEEFEALVEPPLAERLEPDGLRLVLEAPSRFHLQTGAPLSYRQIQVGVVTDVELASDASSVEVSVYVRPEYRLLVRENSRFWETGGIEIDLRLMEGLSVEMESLRSLLVGGISLATPEDGGQPASDGMRFRLHDDAEPEWLAWRPTLPIGADLAPDFEHPPLERAELRWKDDGVLRRGRSRSGWLVPVAGGWLGPADLLTAVSTAREPGATLEVGGRAALLDGEPDWSGGGLARRALPLPSTREWVAPKSALGDARDCLLLAGGGGALRSLAAAHLTRADDAWRVADSIGFGADWHGALVLERESQAWIGVLLVDAQGARVV